MQSKPNKQGSAAGAPSAGGAAGTWTDSNRLGTRRPFTNVSETSKDADGAVPATWLAKLATVQATHIEEVAAERSRSVWSEIRVNTVRQQQYVHVLFCIVRKKQYCYNTEPIQEEIFLYCHFDTIQRSIHTFYLVLFRQRQYKNIVLSFRQYKL